MDEPRYSKLDFVIAIGLAVLIALWIVAYAAVAVRTLLT
jgi:hypothetical protein